MNLNEKVKYSYIMVIGSISLYELTVNEFAMSSQNVESTICNGKWLMKEREIVVLDEAELLEKVKVQAEKIRNKANINLVSKFKIVK